MPVSGGRGWGGEWWRKREERGDGERMKVSVYLSREWNDELTCTNSKLEGIEVC